MRLEFYEQNLIVSIIQSIFGDAKVSLFGSRLDDKKKGGDIDLFVIPSERSYLFEKKIKALAKLERVLHKPVDIVVHKNFEREIEKEILRAHETLNLNNV